MTHNSPHRVTLTVSQWRTLLISLYDAGRYHADHGRAATAGAVYLLLNEVDNQVTDALAAADKAAGC